MPFNSNSSNNSTANNSTNRSNNRTISHSPPNKENNSYDKNDTQIILNNNNNLNFFPYKEKNKSRFFDIYKEEDIIAANNEPYIVHYSNKRKPWNNIGIYMENY